MDHEQRRPVIQIGDIVHVPQSDVLYGSGALTVRVTALGADLVRYPTLEWIHLCGVLIHPDRTEGDAVRAMIRVDALRRPGAVTRAGEAGIPATHPVRRPVGGVDAQPRRSASATTIPSGPRM